MLKIWLDDIRPKPDDSWSHARSVNEAIQMVKHCTTTFETASLDHDLGDFAYDGGDGFRFVLWMAEHDRWPVYKPVVHSKNPVGAIRMRKDIDHYWG